MIGYKTPNILINLGTVAALIFVYLLKLVMLPFIWYIDKKGKLRGMCLPVWAEASLAIARFATWLELPP